MFINTQGQTSLKQRDFKKHGKIVLRACVCVCVCVCVFVCVCKVLFLDESLKIVLLNLPFRLVPGIVFTRILKSKKDELMK